MRRISLLIVDDDPMDRTAVRKALEAAGVQALVEEATDLNTARQMIEMLSFDCVLLDRGLPDGDGVSLIPDVLQRSANTAIVLVTGLDDDDAAVASLRAGAQDYLTKDRIEAGLVPTIRHAIERQRIEAINVSERQRLNLKSQRDALTGTSGEQSIDEYLREELSLQIAHGWPLSAVVLQCDDLAGVRRQHGHMSADRLLRHVATRMSVELRRHDRLGRIGESHFIALLRCSDQHQSMLVAQRLVQAVRELHLPGRNRPVGCTATAAVVPVPPDVRGASDLVKRASFGLDVGRALGGDQAVHGCVGGRLLPIPAPLAGNRVLARLDDVRIGAQMRRVVSLKGRTTVAWQVVYEPVNADGAPLPYVRAAALASGTDLALDVQAIAAAVRAADDPRVASLHIPVQERTLMQSSSSDTIRSLCEALGRTEICLQLDAGLLSDDLDPLALRLKTLRGLGASVGLRNVDAGDRSLLAIACLRPWYIIGHTEALLGNYGESPKRASRLSNLYRAFNVTAIADDVVDESQAQRLAEMGVGYAQGPLFGAQEPFMTSKGSATGRRRRATIPAR